METAFDHETIVRQMGIIIGKLGREDIREQRSEKKGLRGSGRIYFRVGGLTRKEWGGVRVSVVRASLRGGCLGDDAKRERAIQATGQLKEADGGSWYPRSQNRDRGHPTRKWGTAVRARTPARQPAGTPALHSCSRNDWLKCALIQDETRAVRSWQSHRIGVRAFPGLKSETGGTRCLWWVGFARSNCRSFSRPGGIRMTARLLSLCNLTRPLRGV